MSPLHTQRLGRSTQDSALLSLARTVRTSFSFRSLQPTRAGAQPAASPQRGRRPLPAGLLPLAAQIKHELQAAFDRGEQPAVADFVETHPELAAHPQVMLSLLFEEFCLREQHGLAPDPDSFCARYEPWRDSLASQIRVHHELSRHVSLARDLIVFPESGDQVLHYELLDELGEGGSARVYVARDTSLGGRLCALKLSMDQGAEAALQARLDHPHIIPVHSVEHDSQWNLRALCMPLLPGVVLAQAIESLHDEGPPRDADALARVLSGPDGGDFRPDSWSGFPAGGSFADAVAWLGLKLAEALDHAHGRGVFHRDIKPANILLTGRLGPMLFDFNLAHGQIQGQDAAVAATGGTLPYMAPEQLAAFLDSRRWADVAAPADLYSLGLVLRELLVGPSPPPPPVPASQTTQLIADLWAQRCAEPPGPVRSPSRRIPFALDAVLARCLNPNLSERYASAAELAEDLRAYLRHQPLRHAVNPSRRERAANALRRQRLALAAVALVACGAILLAVALRFLGASSTAPPPSGPVLAEYYVDQANIFTRAGRLDQAAEDYRQAIQLAPSLYAPYMGLGRIAFQRSRYEEAAALYSQALALMPPGEQRYDRIASLDSRGRSHFNLAFARQQDAVQRYERNGSKRTDGADRLMRLAADSYAQARDDLTTALTLAQNNTDRVGASPGFPADIQQRLATALLGFGDTASWFDDYEMSVTSYRQALDHAEMLLGSLTVSLSAQEGISDVPTEERPRLERASSEVRTLIATLQERLQADEPKHDGSPAE